MPPARTIGETIRQRRKERELTQETLAERLGIERVYLSRWENDRISPTKHEHLEALARELGGDPSDYARSRAYGGAALDGRLNGLEDRMDSVEAAVGRIERRLFREVGAPE